MSDPPDGRPFKYEVAFSFLAHDEPIAAQLNDMLQDRLSTFLYSERQKELAGRDGEQVFNEVFSEQARIVALLYRDGWGASPWTRIEETAIRNRGHAEGYDFLTLIPTTAAVAPPRWLPRNRIWVGLDRWGINGAAAALEARVQDAFGAVRTETIAERAARADRALQRAEEKLQYRNSPDGVRAAKAGYVTICGTLSEKASSIAEANPALSSFRAANAREFFVVYGLDMLTVLYWRNQYSNTLDGSSLRIDWCRGGWPEKYGMGWREVGREGGSIVRSTSFEFGLDPTGSPAWHTTGASDRYMTSVQLAEHVLTTHLDFVTKSVS